MYPCRADETHLSIRQMRYLDWNLDVSALASVHVGPRETTPFTRAEGALLYPIVYCGNCLLVYGFELQTHLQCNAVLFGLATTSS